MDRLKSAEARAEYGEKTVQKLNLRYQKQEDFICSVELYLFCLNISLSLQSPFRELSAKKYFKI